MCTSEVIGEFDESSLRAVVCSDARFKAFIKLMEIYEELYRAISYSTVSAFTTSHTSPQNQQRSLLHCMIQQSFILFTKFFQLLCVICWFIWRFHRLSPFTTALGSFSDLFQQTVQSYHHHNQHSTPSVQQTWLLQTASDTFSFKQVHFCPGSVDCVKDAEVSFS